MRLRAWLADWVITSCQVPNDLCLVGLYVINEGCIAPAVREPLRHAIYALEYRAAVVPDCHIINKLCLGPGRAFAPSKYIPAVLTRT